MYGNTIRDGPHVDFNREIFRDKDGENVCLDWVEVHSKFDNKK